jgi:hypothetical protein
MTGTILCHDHSIIFLYNLGQKEIQTPVAFVDYFAAVWPIRGYLSTDQIYGAPNDYTKTSFADNPCIYGMLSRTNKPTFPSI